MAQLYFNMIAFRVNQLQLMMSINMLSNTGWWHFRDPTPNANSAFLAFHAICIAHHAFRNWPGYGLYNRTSSIYRACHRSLEATIWNSVWFSLRHICRSKIILATRQSVCSGFPNGSTRIVQLYGVCVFHCVRCVQLCTGCNNLNQLFAGWPEKQFSEYFLSIIGNEPNFQLHSKCASWHSWYQLLLLIHKLIE